MSAALLGCLVAVIVALPSSALWAVPLTVGQRRAGRLCAMAVSFECTTESVLAPERLFDLARDITTHTDSMSRSRETAVGGVRSGLIGLDEEVTWRAWHFGLPLRMTSRITAMSPPRSFTDEQSRGPFRYFAHEHMFLPHGAGTLMLYTSPSPRDGLLSRMPSSA